MILGNPYKFAIIIQIIKQWNKEESADNPFCNGVLLFCIDGNIYTEEILTATLKTEVYMLLENLHNISVDKKIYHMKKEKAFKKMYHLIFSEEYKDIKYYFNISPYCFLDNQYYVFAVSDGTNIRILASKLKYIKKYSNHKLKNINVNEAIISMKELNDIIYKLEKFDYFHDVT